MNYADAISLVAVTATQDSIGQAVKTKTEHTVYANRFNISSSEYYAAGQAGLKPVLKFELRSIDYAGEMLLKHNGVEYNIVITEYRGEFTRLSCERVLGNG